MQIVSLSLQIAVFGETPVSPFLQIGFTLFANLVSRFLQIQFQPFCKFNSLWIENNEKNVGITGRRFHVSEGILCRVCRLRS